MCLVRYIHKRALLAKQILEEILLYFEGKEEIDGIRSISEAILSDELYPDFEVDKDGTVLLPKDEKNPDKFLDFVEAMQKKNTPGGVQSESVDWVTKGEGKLPTLKEGSMYKRSDGRWMGKYYDHGTRKSVYAASKLELISKMNQRILDRNKDDSPRNKAIVKTITLSDGINEWYDDWIKANTRSKPLSSATIENVKTTLIRYVANHKLAKKSLSKITPDDIDTIIDSIPTKSVQARSFSYLKMVYERLIKKRMIKENPIEQVNRRARPAPKRKYIPDPDTWHQFLDWLKEKDIDNYYISKFLADTGMRIGEAVALQHSDISLEKRYATVSKSYSKSAKQMVDHPKTDAGFRRVPLFDDALEVISSIPRKPGIKEIFWMISKTESGKKFAKYTEEFGIPRMPIHNLRHYFASVCYSNGIDKKTYSIWMGHAEIGVTMDTYTHVTPQFEQQQISKMAKKQQKKK